MPPTTGDISGDTGAIVCDLSAIQAALA